MNLKNLLKHPGYRAMPVKPGFGNQPNIGRTLPVQPGVPRKPLQAPGLKKQRRKARKQQRANEALTTLQGIRTKNNSAAWRKWK